MKSKNPLFYIKIYAVLSAAVIISIAVLALLGMKERKGYLSEFKINADKTLELNGLDIDKTKQLFTIDNTLDYNSITNYIFTNKSITNYSYDFRIKYYSKIFRNSDIYGVYPNVNQISEDNDFIKNIEMEKDGSPFGKLNSTKEINYTLIIENIFYTLKIKKLSILYMVLFIVIIILIPVIFREKIPVNIVNEQIYSFNIFRFFAVLFIAVMHWHAPYAKQAYLGVELCFMISGFFLAVNYDKYRLQPLKTILKTRIGSFYPHYIISFSLLLAMNNNFKTDQLINHLFFLSCLNITPLITVVFWFLGAYVVAFAFYTILIKKIEKDNLLIAVAAIVILCFWAMGHVNFNALDAHLDKNHHIVFLPFGIVRGIAIVGIGYLVGSIRKQNINNPFANFNNFIELSTLFYILYIVFHKPTAKFDIPACIILSLLILSFSYKTSFISKMLEKIGCKLNKLFKLFMPIYIYHMVVLSVLSPLLATPPPPYLILGS